MVVKLETITNDLNKLKLVEGKMPENEKECVVEERFLEGTNSKIGDNNKIAPLSAVYKGCKNNCYMAGNPALKIGSIE